MMKWTPCFVISKQIIVILSNNNSFQKTIFHKETIDCLHLFEVDSFLFLLYTSYFEILHLMFQNDQHSKEGLIVWTTTMRKPNNQFFHQKIKYTLKIRTTMIVCCQIKNQ